MCCSSGKVVQNGVDQGVVGILILAGFDLTSQLVYAVCALARKPVFSSVGMAVAKSCPCSWHIVTDEQVLLDA